MEISSINPAKVKFDRPEPSAASSERARDKSRETKETKEVNDKTVAVTKAELDTAVKNANDTGQLLKRKLNFTVDDATERIVVKIIDEESGKIVRQVPPQEMLRIAAHLKQLREMSDQVMSAAKSVILDLKY